LGADPVAGERSGLQVAAVCSIEGLEGLGPEWQNLFERSKCASVFLSFEWMSEWWKSWGDRRNLFIVTVRDTGGDLVGLAALSINVPVLGRLGPASVRFIADEFVGSDYLDLLVDPAFPSSVPEAVARFLLQSKERWDYLCFSHCQDSPLLSALRMQMRGGGMIERSRPDSICPYISLPVSFEVYLGEIGAKLRKNFRRGYRSLQQKGQLDFRTVTEAAEMERRFEDLIRLHRLGFAANKVESSFLLPAPLRFHKEVVKRLVVRGWARLYVLEMDGRPIGALYGFAIAGKFSFYQSGRDPDWNRFEVGHVLNGLCIEQAIKGGHHEFDFLRGGEHYKTKWARHSRVTVSIYFFDRRFKSQLALLRFHAGRELRSLSRGLRRLGTMFQRGPEPSAIPGVRAGDEQPRRSDMTQ